MKLKQLKNMSAQELREQLAQLQQELFKERTDISTKGAPKNTKAIKILRRDIARIHSLLSSKSDGN